MTIPGRAHLTGAFCIEPYLDNVTRTDLGCQTPHKYGATVPTPDRHSYTLKESGTPRKNGVRWMLPFLHSSSPPPSTSQWHRRECLPANNMAPYMVPLCSSSARLVEKTKGQKVDACFIVVLIRLSVSLIISALLSGPGGIFS